VFYDWLYLSALYEHREGLRNHIFHYAGFTDIEFNPERSINCQARSCVLLVSLMKKDWSRVMRHTICPLLGIPLTQLGCWAQAGWGSPPGPRGAPSSASRQARQWPSAGEHALPTTRFGSWTAESNGYPVVLFWVHRGEPRL
jgi:hypothetical protein